MLRRSFRILTSVHHVQLFKIGFLFHWDYDDLDLDELLGDYTYSSDDSENVAMFLIRVI